MVFDAGKDLLVVEPQAVFVGTVDGGRGANTLELAAGTATGTLSGLGSQFVRFGTVTVDAGAAWQLTGSNTIPYAATLVVAGTLTNRGTLVVDGTLLVTDSGTITGTVTLSGTGHVVNQSGGTIDSVSTSAGAGVNAVGSSRRR